MTAQPTPDTDRAAERNTSGSHAEATSQQAPARGTPGYDEWLLDESIEETFPVSDPMLPVRPGSTLSRRHQAAGRINDDV